VFIVTTLVLMMTVSHQWLHIDFISLVPLVFLTSVGLFGMGLAVGGLSLVFKRTQNLQQLVQFAFVALVAVPVTRVSVFKFLPIAWGNELIRRVTVHGASIFSMPLRDTGFLFVHAVAWFAVGLIAFGRFERIARERALLGQY
jgi:ABC-2 type transport system permease protein